MRRLALFGWLCLWAAAACSSPNEPKPPTLSPGLYKITAMFRSNNPTRELPEALSGSHEIVWSVGRSGGIPSFALQSSKHVWPDAQVDTDYLFERIQKPELTYWHGEYWYRPNGGSTEIIIYLEVFFEAKPYSWCGGQSNEDAHPEAVGDWEGYLCTLTKLQ